MRTPSAYHSGASTVHSVSHTAARGEQTTGLCDYVRPVSPPDLACNQLFWLAKVAPLTSVSRSASRVGATIRVAERQERRGNFRPGGIRVIIWHRTQSRREIRWLGRRGVLCPGGRQCGLASPHLGALRSPTRARLTGPITDKVHSKANARGVGDRRSPMTGITSSFSKRASGEKSTGVYRPTTGSLPLSGCGLAWVPDVVG